MGFKRTSQLLNIGASVNESAANTFTEEQLNLPLSTLDREVFIVTDLELTISSPDAPAPGVATAVFASLTKTSQTAIANINQAECIGRIVKFSEQNAAGGTVVYADSHPTVRMSTGTKEDFLAVIATPNFFIQVAGQNNAGAEASQAKLTGYRAVADASLYAALVTEELNA